MACRAQNVVDDDDEDDGGGGGGGDGDDDGCALNDFKYTSLSVSLSTTLIPRNGYYQLRVFLGRQQLIFTTCECALCEQICHCSFPLLNNLSFLL